MLTIVFLDRDTLSPETMLRPPGFPHELVVHDRTTAEQVRERIARADIVISNKVPLRRESLIHAPRLKMIAVAATGTDIVDLAAAKERGITVSNIRNYAKHTVPEHTFALMLALRRSIVPYRQSVLDGRWQQAAQFCFFDHPIADLGGSALGIIGHGTLGKAVGRIADRAVQVHGGAGYVADYGIERFYRDVRIFRIYEGTSQVQQVIIARNLLRAVS